MKQTEVDLIKQHLANLTYSINRVSIEPAIPRLDRFQDWRIERSGNTIRFGCGAVKIRKDDLLLVANYLEIQGKYKAAMTRLVKGYQNHKSTITENSIKRIGAKTLRAIAG